MNKGPELAKPSMTSFFVLWSGQALSLLGSMSVQFALIWWLTATTGSATVLAAATLLGVLPLALMGPLIGAWVDRWNRKRIMLWSDAGSAVASLVLAVLFLTDLASVGMVLALLFVRGVAGAFHAPAMLASTTLMVPEEHLTRIQGLNQGLQGGQLIITAPLGAFMVGAFPMAGVMAVDVVTAFLAIGPLLWIHVPQPRRTGEATETAGGSTWSDVRAGLRYLREREGHMWLLGMAAIINLCMLPAFSLLPLLVIEQHGGAMQLGWMNSLLGVGMIVGGVVLGVWGGFKRRLYTSFAGFVGAGLATLLLGSAPTAAPALVAISLLGITVPLANGPIQAVLQATVAHEYQGRVFAIYTSLATIVTPVGLILAAPIADLFGIRAWYAAGGLACILCGIAGFLIPTLSRLEERGHPERGQVSTLYFDPEGQSTK